MKKPVLPEKINRGETMREPLSLQAAIREANRCLLCHDAPCSDGCPAGTDPAKFIRQIRFYNYKGAARTIRNNNILGTVCSFICPVEKLCEKECSAKALEDPINIAGLQRFAAEYGQSHAVEPMEKSLNHAGRVAVIGAGPAGMGCAAELAKLNYKVVIFEKENHAGGVPFWNIPDYRLPLQALLNDLKVLNDLGVQINYNSPITTDDDLTRLFGDGFEAVFVSTGLAIPLTLPLLKGFSNATDYISFLRKVKFNRADMNLTGKNVAVIGGGSVAIDSAVSAKAAGAAKVYLISLEHLNELPADQEEIHLARLMNIEFRAGQQITGIIADKPLITGIKGVETEWVEPGNFSPDNARIINGTEFSLRTDWVVQAIGTKPNITGLERLNKKGKGLADVNNHFETNLTGVFAGGDLVNGGATVVQAVGEGKKAAAAIHNFIKWRVRK